MKMWFTIRELSRITGRPVMHLRQICGSWLAGRHGVAPDFDRVDLSPGELAVIRVLARLHELTVPTHEIASFLRFVETEAADPEGLPHLPDRLLRRFAGPKAAEAIRQVLDEIQQAREGIVVTQQALPSRQVATIRFQGGFADGEVCLGIIARKMKPHLAGNPFFLYYQCEHREKDADLEVGYPVRAPIAMEGLTLRELPGGLSLSAVHSGPPASAGYAYEALFRKIKSMSLSYRLPLREVYRKGLRRLSGSGARRQITEVQILLDSAREAVQAHLCA